MGLAVIFCLMSQTFLLVILPVDSVTAKLLVEISPVYIPRFISNLVLLLFAALHNKPRQVPPTLEHSENGSHLIASLHSKLGLLETTSFSFREAHCPAVAQIVLLWLCGVTRRVDSFVAGQAVSLLNM